MLTMGKAVAALRFTAETSWPTEYTVLDAVETVWPRQPIF